MRPIMPAAGPLSDDDSLTIFQGGRLRRTTKKGMFGGIENRIKALEEAPPSNLAGRVQSLEDWKNSPASVLSDLEETPSGMGVSVVGIEVMRASRTREVLTSHAQSINAINAALREKGLISA